jgi:HK97 family phage prohead protease
VPTALKFEHRGFPHKSLEIREGGEGSTLVGVAAPYETLSAEMWGFREKIRKGAFDRSLAENDILALYSHEDEMLLGRTGSGTLTLRSTDAGLEYELSLPNTSYANDLKALVHRGDIGQCSFGFIARAEEWDYEAKPNIRTLADVDLKEISFVANPAYTVGTSANLRHLNTSSFDGHDARRRRRLFSFFTLRHPPRS